MCMHVKYQALRHVCRIAQKKYNCASENLFNKRHYDLSTPKECINISP